MPEPRFKRRKEDRPAEITEAALSVFSEKGYDAARVDDVAQRAGVSKGLLYLYFKTKEELFKAVIKSFITPKIKDLQSQIESSDRSAEEFLRGPFLEFAKQVPRSPVKILVRLMVAEGSKHPDLVAYYWENVAKSGIALLTEVFAKGVRDGHFRQSALNAFPHLLVSPVLFSVVWSIVFSKQQQLDIDTMLEQHLNLILNSISLNNAGTGAS